MAIAMPMAKTIKTIGDGDQRHCLWPLGKEVRSGLGVAFCNNAAVFKGGAISLGGGGMRIMLGDNESGGVEALTGRT